MRKILLIGGLFSVLCVFVACSGDGVTPSCPEVDLYAHRYNGDEAAERARILDAGQADDAGLVHELRELAQNPRQDSAQQNSLVSSKCATAPGSLSSATAGLQGAEHPPEDADEQLRQIEQQRQDDEGVDGN